MAKTTSRSSSSTQTTALLFGILDPVLQPLLEDLTSLKELLVRLNRNRTAPFSSTDDRRHRDDEENFVRLSNRIAEGFESLSRSLRLTSLADGGGGKHQQQHQHATSLCLLADYVTLPLTAIFHLPLREILTNASEAEGCNPSPKDDPGQEKEWRRRLAMRRSRVFRMYRCAAFAVQTYVEETSLGTRNNSDGDATNDKIINNHEICNNGSLLPSEVRMKCLVALVRTMPSFSELTEAGGSESGSGGAAAGAPCLDDGRDDLWRIVLDATSCLLETFGTGRRRNDREPETIGHDDGDPVRLLEAWHGTLGMRLVDCLTAFLGNNNTSSNNGGSAVGANGGGRFSPLVQRSALGTLLVLLEVTAAVPGQKSSPSPQQSTATKSCSSCIFWRSIFPGVFTALYQRVMDGSRINSSANARTKNLPTTVQELGLESMIGLLRATLVVSKPLKVIEATSTDHKQNANVVVENEHSSNSNNDLLARLTSMAAAANREHEENKSNEKRGKDSNSYHEIPKKQDDQQRPAAPPSEPEPFFRKVQQRVEGPLLVLLKYTSVAPSDATRRKVVRLCGLILFEASKQLVWSSMVDRICSESSAAFVPSASVMEKVCFELCIGFQQDTDGVVRISSREVIAKYTRLVLVAEENHGDESVPKKEGCENGSLPSLSSGWMAPRIIELVQTASARVQNRGDVSASDSSSSGRAIIDDVTGIELQSEMNLISGYLRYLNDDDAYTNQNYRRRETTRNRDNDTEKKDSRTIPHEKTTALTTVITRNVESKNNSTLCVDSLAREGVRSALVSSKQLRKSLIKLFDVDVDSLNENTHKKFVPIVTIDKNDIKKTPVKLRYLHRPDLINLSRETILQSLGKLLGPKNGAIFTDEVLSDFMQASARIPNIEGNNYFSSSSTMEDSYDCWLHEWVGSLIVARDILSGSFSGVTGVGESRKEERRKRRILRSLASSILPLLVGSSLWNLSIESKGSSTALSPKIFQRNTIVMVLLLELIREFCFVLCKDVQHFLPHILYPIIDKTIRGGSTMCANVVQAMGLSTLEILSVSCGLRSTEDLIFSEQNQLMAALVGRLRLPGGSNAPGTYSEAQEIISVCKNFLWVIKMIKSRKENTDAKRTKSSIVDFVSLLDYRLDHLFLKKMLHDTDVETICSLHKAFYEYFLYIFDVQADRIYSYKSNGSPNHEARQSWLGILSNFRHNNPEISDTDNECGAESDEGNILDIDKTDVALFAKLVARDCYLLSHQKLLSRVSSCDALTTAFKFLAFVGSEHKDPSDDTNFMQNSVLRQVAESWPSIRARLRTLSEEVLASSSIDNSSVVLVLSQSKVGAQERSLISKDVGVQRIFLSNLFALIAAMCECSGDFFADRFRHDVWPAMACHLELLLKKLQRHRDSHSRSLVPLTIPNDAINNMSDSERQLIDSILTCLNRIIGQNECGRAVEKLLGSIGFTLIPLFDIEGELRIQELAMECIRNIIRIDSDILRRPLMELTGNRIPPCLSKFGNKKLKNHLVVVPVSIESKEIMAFRCSKLLELADSLPEQPIS